MAPLRKRKPRESRFRVISKGPSSPYISISISRSIYIYISVFISISVSVSVYLSMCIYICTYICTYVCTLGPEYMLVHAIWVRGPFGSVLLGVLVGV